MWVGIHYQKPKMKDSTSCSIKKYTNKTTSCDLQGWGYLHPSNNSARSSQASACRKQNWERTTTANLWLTLHRPLVSIWRRSAWKIARLHCTFLYNSHANNVSAFPTNARMLMPQCDFSHYSQFNARIALNGCFNLRSKTFVYKCWKSTETGSNVCWCCWWWNEKFNCEALDYFSLTTNHRAAISYRSWLSG